MTIDVSEILSDSDMAVTFSVIRRTATVSPDTGRNVAEEQQEDGVVGVIVTVDPSSTDKTEDSTMAQEHISVITSYRLRAGSEGILADIVLWRDRRYLVNRLKSHTQWGSGFVKATAVLMAASVPPQV